MTATSTGAGGLVGRTRSGTLDISECYNVGTVTAASNAAAMIGVAGADVTVTNSYNAGKIEGTESGNDFAASTATVTLTDCYDQYGTQARKVSEEMVAGGELCYLLNHEGLSMGALFPRTVQSCLTSVLPSYRRFGCRWTTITAAPIRR